MKSLIAQIAALPSTLFSVLAIVLALVISGALIYLIGLPSYQGLGKLGTEIEAEKVKTAAIDASINNLRGQDKEVIEAINKFISTYVPGAVDNLHFATLNEAVSNAAAVTVTNMQISQAAKAPPPPAAGTASTGQTNQTATAAIAVSYTSNFDSLLRLVIYWKLADQLVAIKSLDISGVSGDTLNYTLSYDLPTSPVVQKAVVEDNLVFTKAQAQELLELKNKIIFTASPSAQSVGKSNPFN